MENAMLTFDNVSAHYGKIQALHNVSLHIKQGEREPGDGRFFCRPRSVPDPHQMGV